MKELLSFLKLLHQFRDVERMIYINEKAERRENDVEHSYELAMTAWYIIESKKLNLDIDKVLRLSLLHDFVEVYAGDTFVYDKDPEVINSKKEREEKALIRLKKEFKDAEFLWDVIEEYERKDSPEAIFIYVLDKLLPFLNCSLNKGIEWKESDITLDLIKETKEAQMVQSPDIEPYYREFIKMLEENHEEYFGK